MAVRLRCAFETERGWNLVASLWSKQSEFNAQCSCPERTCYVLVEELPQDRFQVTVARPRAVLIPDDWPLEEPNIGHYVRVFDNASIDDIADSVGRLLEMPLLDRSEVEMIDDFLFHLGNVRDQFYWKLIPDRGWHSGGRSETQLELLAFAKVGQAEGIALDPIGAVCYALTRAVFDRDQWKEAARTVGLPSESASDLIAAASDKTRRVTGDQRKPVEELRFLRARLLRTVGL